MTHTEAALLVALPQSPERRRPDLFPLAAFQAKTKVLETISTRINLDLHKLEELKKEPLPVRLSRPKSIALHVEDRLIQNPSAVIETSINASWQRDLISILSASVQKYEKPINIAGLVVERRTGLVKAYAGSSSYIDNDRKGSVNYLTVPEPGSTLNLDICEGSREKLIEEGHVFKDSQIQRGATRLKL